MYYADDCRGWIGDAAAIAAENQFWASWEDEQDEAAYETEDGEAIPLGERPRAFFFPLEDIPY